jgi:hypothetical protein
MFLHEVICVKGLLVLWCLMPLLTIFQGQATGKLYDLRCESSAPFFVIYKAGREHTLYFL